jgi:glycosyltransferase involved in cell wall biosynthesis
MPSEWPMRPRYSVVIPVFNSAALVAETIDRTLEVFRKLGQPCELILVNDGSTDDSWRVLRSKALGRPNVIAINLLKNYGQHAAILCGFRQSSGDWVITLDDDLQNPPEEIVHLIEGANRGHDVVCGRFRQKQHAGYRRLGSRIVGLLDRHIFKKPKGLALTNFRIIRRDVIDRILAYPTSYPYIRGLMLLCSNNPADVLVDHRPRPGGGTSYTVGKLVVFVARIVFTYSTLPVRAVLALGTTLILTSALAALFISARQWLVPDAGIDVWLWLVIAVVLLHGVTITAIGIVAEYVVRFARQARPSYQVQDIVTQERVASVPTRVTMGEP